MARNDGWLPQQHGAWAMLTVPSLLGLVAYVWTDALSWLGLIARLMLVATFFAGYFLFNAASLWLKATPRRRPPLLRPLLIYATTTVLLGLASLALLGAALLWWVLPYAPLAATALWLVHAHRERSVVSGAATVAAASLFHTVVAEPLWLAAPHLATAARPLWVSLLCFLYFFGTVWTVKTMIRQRGSRRWWAASLGYHALASLVTLAGWATGALSVFYVVFLGACLMKAWALPRLGPMAREPRVLSPATIGVVELVFSLVLTALVVGVPPLS